MKKIIFLDCMILATLYSIRIIAGGSIIGTNISFWLISFSAFLFLSLSFVKRFSELHHLKDEKIKNKFGRAYQFNDKDWILPIGISSGFSSVLVFSLYLQDELITNLYCNIYILYAVLPVIFYWIGWIWLSATRGKIDKDPIIFALKDKNSILSISLIVILFFLSKVCL